MRPAFLQVLRCPICVTRLDMEVFSARVDEVAEGALHCRTCNAVYPIIDHIPRMLPDDLAGEMRELNRDFFARYPQLLPAAAAAGGTTDAARAQRRTLRSFSFQWNTFDDTTVR